MKMPTLSLECKKTTYLLKVESMIEDLITGSNNLFLDATTVHKCAMASDKRPVNSYHVRAGLGRMPSL